MPRGSFPHRSFFLGVGGGQPVQTQYAENAARPVAIAQAAPGGPYVTLLSVPITTSGGRLVVLATVNGEVAGGVGATFVEGAIRVLIDGVSPGLGARQTVPVLAGLATPRVSLGLNLRSAVLAAGAHTVALQWSVDGDGAAAKTFTLNTVDFDGASLIVQEVLP